MFRDDSTAARGNETVLPCALRRTGLSTRLWGTVRLWGARADLSYSTTPQGVKASPPTSMRRRPLHKCLGCRPFSFTQPARHEAHRLRVSAAPRGAAVACTLRAEACLLYTSDAADDM
eukprot:3433881-Prymnesium_polylepis.2